MKSFDEGECLHMYRYSTKTYQKCTYGTLCDIWYRYCRYIKTAFCDFNNFICEVNISVKKHPELQFCISHASNLSENIFDNEYSIGYRI